MMLPGAVSLGAYEGGALAAILVAVQEARGELVIDSMATASAGSITGLIACRALLCGADPVALMSGTWVDMPSLENLKTHDPISPLSMDKLATAATKLLDPDEGVPDGPSSIYRQDESVTLSMAVTVLGGLTYQLTLLEDPSTDITPIEAQTYLDWYRVTLDPGAGAENFLAAVNGALASGSTPVGFPPRLMVRDDPATVNAYRSAGIVEPPNNWTMWDSDGGDIDNAPFGRLIDLIEAAPTEPGDNRAIVMLQMDSPQVTVGGQWFDPDPSHVPTWTSTLLRVNHIRQNQSIYEDLRRLEKTNARIGWIKMVGEHLQAGLDHSVSDLSPDQRQQVLQGVAKALSDASEQMNSDASNIREAIGIPAKSLGPSTDPPPTLVDVLERAAGFSGKQQIKVEVVTPDPSKGSAASQLAGEFLFHFGGFFDVAFRRSDFALGFENARDWLGRFLPNHVTNADQVVAAVARRYEELGWTPNEGGAGPLKLSLKEDAEGAALILHILHVLEYGFRHDIRGHL